MSKTRQFAQMNRRILIVILLLGALLVVGCAATEEATPEPPETTAAEREPAAIASQSDGDQAADMGMSRGMGPGSGMMGRHQAAIPETYAGLTNPLPATEANLEQGAELYGTYCATCHGDGGMGDGPAGAQLDPAPAPVAHTAQMLGDDYLFWRISEGGAFQPFNSAMPAWKGALSEEQRWQVIHYLRALGSGEMMPAGRMGGAMYDPEAELAQRQAMLEEAVAQQVITQAEADLFLEVHDAMDALMAAGMPQAAGAMGAMQEAMLTQLVNNGTISRQQATTFSDVHDRLLQAGLMQ